MIVSLIILVATANIELLLIIVLLLREKTDCVDYDNQSVEEDDFEEY